jgi:hypothetical protein
MGHADGLPAGIGAVGRFRAGDFAAGELLVVFEGFDDSFHMILLNGKDRTARAVRSYAGFIP